MSKERFEIRSVTVMLPASNAWIPFFQSGSVPTIELLVNGLTGFRTAGLISTSPICTVPAVIKASSVRRIPRTSSPAGEVVFLVPKSMGVAIPKPALSIFGPRPGKIATRPRPSAKLGLLALTAALMFTFCP